MGHNATVVVMLDALWDIEIDPAFGKKLSNAILALSLPSSHRTRADLDVSAGCHCNAASVIEEHHADQTVLVAVGGNYGTPILRTWGSSHHEEKDKIKLLKELAEECGYYVAKKPKRRSKEDDTGS